MSGVMHDVFGGSGGQSTSTTTPVSMTPPAYAALQSPVAGQLLSLFSNGGPTYSGLPSVGAPLSTAPANTNLNTFSAPIGSNENTLLGSIMALNGGSAALTPASGYLSNVLSPNYLQNALTNPALTSAITQATAPLVSNYQNVTLPNLAGQFVQNGQVLNGPGQVGSTANGAGSSAFDKAASIAQTGLLQAMGQTAAPITSQFLSSAMGQQTQGATQAQTLSTTQVNNLVSTLQAEALPRLIQQYGMDQGLQEFNNRVNVMLQALGLGVQTSQPDVAEQGQSNSKFDSETGIFPALLGSGGAGGAMGGAAAMGFSDRRLKTDVTMIGHAENGLPLYSFHFVWDKPDDELRYGFMADEVERVHPEAVSTDPFSGYKMVDYDLAVK